LAKWTIANVFSGPLMDRFPDSPGKATLRAEDWWHFDGTGHLEGVTKLAESTYLSWLAWHWLYIQCGVGKRGLPVGRS